MAFAAKLPLTTEYMGIWVSEQFSRFDKPEIKGYVKNSNYV